jgi:uncharacterized protein
MLIGIMSDTHGDAARTSAAARLLVRKGAKTILHCGDIGSADVLVELSVHILKRVIPAYCVLGNVDAYDPSLAHFPTSTGIRVCGRFKDMELDGKRVAVIHGDDERRLDEILKQGLYDYVFTGHTHVRSDTLEGRTRVINPGAVYRASPPSVALLDTTNGHLEFLDLDFKPRS